MALLAQTGLTTNSSSSYQIGPFFSPMASARALSPNVPPILTNLPSYYPNAVVFPSSQLNFTVMPLPTSTSFGGSLTKSFEPFNPPSNSNPIPNFNHLSDPGTNTSISTGSPGSPDFGSESSSHLTGHSQFQSRDFSGSSDSSISSCSSGNCTSSSEHSMNDSGSSTSTGPHLSSYSKPKTESEDRIQIPLESPDGIPTWYSTEQKREISPLDKVVQEIIPNDDMDSAPPWLQEFYSCSVATGSPPQSPLSTPAESPISSPASVEAQKPLWPPETDDPPPWSPMRYGH